MFWGLIYFIVITIAEALTAFIAEAQIGIVMHSAILLALIFHGATSRQIQQRRFLLVLSLAPLIRILSISLPLGTIDNFIYWYLIIGALMYMGAFYAAYVSGISYRRMGFTLTGWPRQLPIALLGIVLGLAEFLILRPTPLIPKWDWGPFLFGSFVLMIFTGLLEEFIFRGLVQEAAIGVMGVWGILYGAILFAVLHLGYRSVMDVLFVFIVGGAFGIIVQRTRSLVGVTLAHGFTNISLYLIFPFVLTGIPQQGLIRSIPTPEINFMPGIMAPLPSGAGHFPGRYVISTPAISPAPSPSATLVFTPTLEFFVPTIPPALATSIICTTIPADWVVYLVQPGDTLSTMARRYRTTVVQIQSVNCLHTTLIVVGQQLYVPLMVLPTATSQFSSETLIPTDAVTLTPELPSSTPEPPTPTIEVAPTLEPPTLTSVPSPTP